MENFELGTTGSPNQVRQTNSPRSEVGWTKSCMRESKTMSIFELTAVLNHYKITNVVKNGHVLARAKDQVSNGWVDVTGWSRLQMAAWLNS